MNKYFKSLVVFFLLSLPVFSVEDSETSLIIKDDDLLVIKDIKSISLDKMIELFGKPLNLFEFDKLTFIYKGASDVSYLFYLKDGQIQGHTEITKVLKVPGNILVWKSQHLNEVGNK